MGKFLKLVTAIAAGLFIYSCVTDALEAAFGDPDDDDDCCYYGGDPDGYGDDGVCDDPDDCDEPDGRDGEEKATEEG